MELPRLQELGQVLRARREALGLTRQDVAESMASSAAYLFLIENAKPRRGSGPSRPRRRILLMWAHALHMNREETARLLELAGYDAELTFQEYGFPYVPSSARVERLQRGGAIDDVAGRRRLEKQLDEVLTVAAQTGSPRLWRWTLDRVRTELDAVTARLTEESERMLEQ